MMEKQWHRLPKIKELFFIGKNSFIFHALFIYNNSLYLIAL